MRALFYLLVFLPITRLEGQSLPYRKDFIRPEVLARALTEKLPSEKEKARAIFTWIAENIQYNTAIAYPRRGKFSTWDPSDTMSVWRSADEMTAIRVLYRGTAVCDGYARLFKTLCDYAGLQSVVITGYGRCFGDNGVRFRTNHCWNAVRIDSIWELLDVTWGSGYVNYSGDFVQRTDDNYFMVPPSRFIHDHLPEDLSWTLLANPPAMKEFDREPFRYKSFVKYGISMFEPSGGTIEASPGDTIKIEVQVNDPEKNSKIAPGMVFDSLLANAIPLNAFLTSSSGERRLVYTYVVAEQAPGWINILYNHDPVLRYRLKLKKPNRE